MDDPYIINTFHFLFFLSQSKRKLKQLKRLSNTKDSTTLCFHFFPLSFQFLSFTDVRVKHA